MAVLSRLDMCNVHAAGTIEMKKPRRAYARRRTRPLLIAVTQLTSTSEERMREELLIRASINDTIVKYAQNTRAAGLDGVVCSPLETGMVHGACGEEFLTVTPGVRFCRWRRGGPGARHHARPRDHRGGGPCGGLPPVRRRVRRIDRGSGCLVVAMRQAPAGRGSDLKTPSGGEYGIRLREMERYYKNC